MLQIKVEEHEFYDERTNSFIVVPSQFLMLEHSLVSLSKWESRFLKPFLNKNSKTLEESLYYIECMILNTDFDPFVIKILKEENLKTIGEYIQSPMTATIINKNQGAINRDVITSEIIYYWMVALNIPFECQYWHLNRLLTLVNVCNIMNQPKKKMSREALLRRNSALNAARKAQLNTTG